MNNNFNNNYLWSYIFFSHLSSLGVKYACISPGSRNTPINCALEDINNIKKFVILDERQSAYFALGLAKATKSPVIISTTSGTAVANLYPAIIEAYKSNIPLIVCTADRSFDDLFTDANQTINQNNIFSNHINWFFNFPLPDFSDISLNSLEQIAEKTLLKSFCDKKAPVHLNFPFRKPLEPTSYNTYFDPIKLQNLLDNKKNSFFYKSNTSLNLELITEFLIKKLTGVIILNPDNYDEVFLNELFTTSDYLNYPIFADSASSARFYGNNNVINNYEALIRNNYFTKNFQFDIAIIFGRNNTSIKLKEFLDKNVKHTIIIDENLSYNTNSINKRIFIKSSSYDFCKALNLYFSNFSFKTNNNNLNEIIQLNQKIEDLKKEFLTTNNNFDASYIYQLLETIPDNSNIILGNSLPIRLTNIFAANNNKQFKVFSNRGASGIDGIISTALGISTQNNYNYLLIGDLSFYYDLTALYLANEYEIKLNVIIFDNNGGGIFNLLPISKEQKYFKKYFQVPLEINYNAIANLFNASLFFPESVNNFIELLNIETESFINLFIIQSNSQITNELLNKYYLLASEINLY